ncbi:tektin-2 [Eucyclogobius newberryi]|uniref:tektin-2 n=1 Tax=Eucyclogobius newberryi TaxID=166745 RepID=UPI003B5BF543
MCALPLKPALRHGVPEWTSNNQELSSTAQEERHVSHQVRQEGRTLRNETTCQTNWDEEDTNQRLSDRIWDVSQWRDALDVCARKVDEEMDALTLCKEQLEQALASTVVPLEVGTECLTLREGRSGYELVLDPADQELKAEVALIQRVQQTLQQLIDKAFEHLCVLQENRQQLTADLQNKMDALDIDTGCLSLTRRSPQISLKPNPTRIPSGSCTPEEWLQFSQYNVALAEEAMHLSQQMREEMKLTRAQLQNELDKQRHATEFALRKRTHQEDQARDELQWQIRNMEKEMADMEGDIKALDADLQAKTASLKLAHTRLENRTQRPGMDLCRDQVQHGLVYEVHQLESTIMSLKQKLAEAKNSLQKCKLHHSRMLLNLSLKQQALSLEQRSLNTRTRLNGPVQSAERAPVPLVPLVNSSGRSHLQMLAQ